MSIWLYYGLAIAVLLIVVISVFAFRFATLLQQLHASEERWKFALEGAGDGVWDWDVKADDVVFSPRYREMYGFSDEDVSLKSKQWQERIHPDDRERVRIDVQAYLNGETNQYVNEHRVICKDGSIKWALSRGMIVHRDDEDKPLRMIGTHADITERKNIEQKIQQMAHYDALTELPNRVLINDRLKQALAQAKRENKFLALMFLDLDKFKPVNDTLGHDVGDALLKQVAKRLQLSIRASDTVARIGGDEFVVLLPTVEVTHDAVLVAEKILETLNQPFEIAGHKLNISSSIGIALYPQHATDEHGLLVHADTAMYYSKKAGRNNVQLYREDMQKLN
jgi:diguanylate cyclase (GGDEF)-like protein/PAS domain S-box-containing protein